MKINGHVCMFITITNIIIMELYDINRFTTTVTRKLNLYVCIYVASYFYQKNKLNGTPNHLTHKKTMLHS